MGSPAVPYRTRRRVRLEPALHALAVAAVALVVVFPIYWMVASSLSSRNAFQWPPDLLPSHPSLAAYRTIVDERPIARWFLNSTFVALTTTAFSVLIAINAGLSLSRYRTRLNGSFGAIILITQMLPATLLVIPMYIIFRNLHLLDSLLGLVVANGAFVLPLAIWILKGFFDSVPREIEEAAMIDGASQVGAFYRITVLLALPGIVAVVIYSFMLAWGEFFFARTLITSDTNWVFTMGLTSFQGEYTLQWSEMLAAATIFTIPPLLFFAGLQRHFISGLTGGAVKG